MGTMDNVRTLANDIHCGFFADKPLKDAYEYAEAIAKASDNPASTMTAIHIVLNGVAAELRKITG